MSDKTANDDSQTTSEQKNQEQKQQDSKPPKERLKGIINVRVGDSKYKNND
jgi:hypothetical protein